MWNFKVPIASVKQQSLFGLVFLLFATCLNTKAMAQQEVSQAVESRNHVFANKLFQVIAEEKSGNMVLSPLSLEIVLAVAGLGARENTKAQIANGTTLTLELDTLKRRYDPLLNGIKDDSGCILRIATQMFVEEKYPLKQEFVQSSAVAFHCGLQSVEFFANPEVALQTINTWAEQKTEGLIKNLLDQSAITANTKLVLANAVYFKGEWARQFDPSRTRKEKFYLADGNTVDVDMMHIEKRFRFGHPEGLNAKVLELPYKGDQLSMVILLPDSTSSLTELEEKVSAEAFDLDGLLSNHTYPSEVSVSLPKFKLEVTTNLEEPLAKLGMTDMFTDCANFSGITPSPLGLKVSKVVQKAYIEVSEEGTEAAAATGFVMRQRRSISQKQTFQADRPFTFLISDIKRRTILFIGSCKTFIKEISLIHEEL